jgi:CheY-like chemotaxis protein
MVGARIVVVEDERIVALHLRQQLTKLGYEVVGTAASSDRALGLITRLDPDLVLMDISIEGDVDGVETAARIPPDLNIPIVYLTAHAEPSTLKRAQGTKPYAYLLKPFSERELEATLQMSLERWRTENALRHSEQRFRNIVQASSDWFWEVDAELRYRQVWAHDALARDQTEGLIGRPLFERVDPSYESAAWQALPDHFRERRAFRDVVYREIEPNRGGRFVKTSGVPYFDADGSFHGYRGASADVTKSVSAEEQLHRAQKMEAIGNLTGGMAHDFNNLLGVVVGNLDLLRDRLAQDAIGLELMNEAFDAARRGADLTRRLLAFARRQPLQPQRLDVNALVSGLLKLLSRVLGEDIEVALDEAPDLWPVLADPAQLEAALTNLATNARDAMPRGGKLKFATSNCRLDEDHAAIYADVAPGDYAMVSVSDTGTGIPAHLVGRIFEPFFTTKGPGKGSGLGLSMVFGFLKQSGGHAAVYSEEGIGTIFRLYLPRADRPAEAKSDAPPTPLLTAKGETVLAVEDNPAMRRIVLRQLRDLGYTVLEAENAAQALALVQSARIDLLFSDVVMPGGATGYDIARTALAMRPDLKVLMTSGFPDVKPTDGPSLPAGTRLLSKPYRREELARTLRELLDT